MNGHQWEIVPELCWDDDQSVVDWGPLAFAWDRFVFDLREKIGHE